MERIFNFASSENSLYGESYGLSSKASEAMAGYIGEWATSEDSMAAEAVSYAEKWVFMIKQILSYHYSSRKGDSDKLTKDDVKILKNFKTIKIDLPEVERIAREDWKDNHE